MKRGWHGESHRHYLAAKGYHTERVVDILTLGMFPGGHKEKIVGGLGDNAACSAFNPVELKKGIAVEREHTSDPEIAAEIAKDHLTEDPEYYKKLEIMEKSSLAQLERAER